MLKLENCAKKWLATWHMWTKLTADREQNSIRRPSTDAKSFARYTYRQGASQKENRTKREQHQTIDFVKYVLVLRTMLYYSSFYVQNVWHSSLSILHEIKCAFPPK